MPFLFVFSGCIIFFLSDFSSVCELFIFYFSFFLFAISFCILSLFVFASSVFYLTSLFLLASWLCVPLPFSCSEMLHAAEKMRLQSNYCRHANPGPHRHKFKLWSDEAMTKAYEEVLSGETIRVASEKYAVPKSTLYDRVSGRVTLNARSGPDRYLSDEEEERLAKWLIRCASIGYAKSKKDVLAIVTAMMTKKRGIEVNVSKEWWESFRRRHPQLTIRCAETLAYTRAVAANEETLNQYFDLLEATLTDNQLLDKPSQIFNCDESGFPLDHQGGKLICGKGWKQFCSVASSSRDHITVLACVNAAGNCIPPLIVYDRKNIKREFHTGEIPGTLYGTSAKGWIDAELFEQWFPHFIRYAPSARPLLLLLDGHSSHYQLSLVQKAAENGVIIFCLPPHTTHLIQPLDKTVFGPLKIYWREQCRRFMAQNPGRVVT